MSGGRSETMQNNRGLLALVIGLGVLIAAGFVVVVVTLIHRTLAPSHRGSALEASGPVRAPAVTALGEPSGTRIVAMTQAGDRLALQLTGGGLADRIVLIDPSDGSRVGVVRLEGPPAPPRERDLQR